ncbi:DUF6809 family protein [Bacillus sp. A015]
MKLMGTPAKVSTVRAKLQHIGRQEDKEAHFYDAGMVSVLKYVAAKTIHETEGTEIEWSDATLRTQENVDDLYEKLEGILSHANDLVKLLKDLDDAHAVKASLEIEDAYVTGFVEGFRYLMGEAAYRQIVNFLK